MDVLIRENSFGEETTWYSKEFIEKQMELSYKNGLSVGIKVEFHAMTPVDDSQVNDLTNAFWQKVSEEFLGRFKDMFIKPQYRKEFDKRKL